MQVPLTEMLRQQIELGRAHGQKEYYVQIGPLPEVAAFSLMEVFGQWHRGGSPVVVRLIEVGEKEEK